MGAHVVVEGDDRVRVREPFVRRDRLARALAHRVARVKVPVDDCRRRDESATGADTELIARPPAEADGLAASACCGLGSAERTDATRTGVAPLLENFDLSVVDRPIGRAEEARLDANHLLERALDQVKLIVELGRRDLCDVGVCGRPGGSAGCTRDRTQGGEDPEPVRTGRGKERKEHGRTRPCVGPDDVPLAVQRFDRVCPVVDTVPVVAVDEERRLAARVRDRLAGRRAVVLPIARGESARASRDPGRRARAHRAVVKGERRVPLGLAGCHDACRTLLEAALAQRRVGGVRSGAYRQRGADQEDGGDELHDHKETERRDKRRRVWSCSRCARLSRVREAEKKGREAEQKRQRTVSRISTTPQDISIALKKKGSRPVACAGHAIRREGGLAVS